MPSCHPIPQVLRLALLVLCCAVWVCLGACSSEEKGEDLNVIIPKLINEMKGPPPTQVAADLFNATNPDARRIAVATISKKEWGHEEPYMKAYRLLATDPDPLVRGQALRALGTSHRADVADLLLKGLADNNPLVRQDASAALADIHNDTTIDPLLLHLKDDSDRQTRINCIAALKGYNTPRVLRGLSEGLDDRDAAIARHCHAALTALTGRNYPMESRPWLDYVAQLPAPSAAPAH